MILLFFNLPLAHVTHSLLFSPFIIFLSSFIWSIFIEPLLSTRPIFCGSHHWASLAYHLIQTKPLKWDNVEGGETYNSISWVVYVCVCMCVCILLIWLVTKIYLKLLHSSKLIKNELVGFQHNRFLNKLSF